jgi:hypothetical protein
MNPEPEKLAARHARICASVLSDASGPPASVRFQLRQAGHS